MSAVTVSWHLRVLVKDFLEQSLRAECWIVIWGGIEEQEDILLSLLPSFLTSWGFLALKLSLKTWKDQEAVWVDEASGTYTSVQWASWWVLCGVGGSVLRSTSLPALSAILAQTEAPICYYPQESPCIAGSSLDGGYSWSDVTGSSSVGGKQEAFTECGKLLPENCITISRVGSQKKKRSKAKSK